MGKFGRRIRIRTHNNHQDQIFTPKNRNYHLDVAMNVSGITDEDASGDNLDEIIAHQEMHCAHIGVYDEESALCIDEESSEPTGEPSSEPYP